MATPKTQKILRYSLYALVGAGVLAVVGYGLIVRPLQIRTQKQNFAKAEASIDALALKIEQTISKPDETKKTKSCSYVNQEIRRGPRSCDIRYFMLYRNTDNRKSTDSMTSISHLALGKIRDDLGKSTPVLFVPSSEKTLDQIFYQDLPDANNLSCGLQYTYPVQQHQYSNFSSMSGENMEIKVDCGGPAMAEYFPVTN